MADPIPPPVETIEDAFARASAANRELRRARPGETPDEARARICERMRLQELSKETSHKVTTGAVAVKQANGANGHAPVAKPADGESRGFTRGELRVLAEGLVPFLREQLAPLEHRCDELENVVRNLVSAVGRHE